MSTWNVITIENPGTLTVDTLPYELTSDGEIWEGYDATDQREDVPEREIYTGYAAPGRKGDPDGAIVIAGHSKYRADEAIAALIQLTADNPGMKVTHYEEYDYDEQGADASVYANGALVREESKESRLVPLDLDRLVKAAREHVFRDKHGDVAFTMGAGAGKSIMALLDALDPEGAK